MHGGNGKGLESRGRESFIRDRELQNSEKGNNSKYYSHFESTLCFVDFEFSFKFMIHFILGEQLEKK